MDASLSLIRALIDAMKIDAGVAALVGSKIYDRPPERQTATGPVLDIASPYISFGPTDALAANATCITGEEIILQIDAWSWGAGQAYASAEVRNIAGAVRQCLHDRSLAIADHLLVSLEYRRNLVMREPDGVTNHAVIQFTAFVQQP